MCRLAQWFPRSRDGDLERAVAQTVREFGKLDAIFANAGFGVIGSLKKLSVEDYRRQFETNVFGVLRTIYAALPEIEKTRGNIVIIGSVAGWSATPGTSPYSMSKFALRALANCIMPELRPLGVKVTLISPGFVDSNIRRLRAVARGKREAIITNHGKIAVAIERFAPWLIRAAGRK